MNKIASIVMYLLWTATIIAVLTATFTSFQYIDINIIAGILLLFATANTYFVSVSKPKK